MTEADWLAAESPLELVTFLDNCFWERDEENESEAPAEWWTGRKLRLWAVACCRRVDRLLVEPRSRAGLDAVEKCVDGELEGDALREAIHATERATLDSDVASCPTAQLAAAKACETAIAELEHGFRDSLACALSAASYARRALSLVATPAEETPEERAQADLLREVFGNPFRPVALDPAWLTSDVRALAHAIYAERAWDRMPILADALQEAGCENEDVLAHCRSATAPHVRGCWVVDLLLGKGGPA
jgi:hypothetical protein